MKIRAQIHLMPYEIDNLLLVLNQFKRSSFYLEENDIFSFDIMLNLSSKLINWKNSNLDKQFFFDKYHSIKHVTDWTDSCKFDVYEGDEMYGHLDLTRKCINDNEKSDAYLNIVPDIHFHESLLYYLFRSMEQTETNNYIITPQIPKLWDGSWDSIVNDFYSNVSYENHRNIDCYHPEVIVRNNLDNIYIEENNRNFKWAQWFDLVSSDLLELLKLPDSFYGYGPLDTFYLHVLEHLKDKINFKHYILKNQIVADRWKIVDKKDSDPAPWNHSQETPMRDFYKSRLDILDTKNNQRNYIENEFKKEINLTINRIIGEVG